MWPLSTHFFLSFFFFETEPESVIGSNVSCENTLIPEPVTRAGIWGGRACRLRSGRFTTTGVGTSPAGLLRLGLEPLRLLAFRGVFPWSMPPHD